MDGYYSTSQLVHPDTCFVFVTWDSILSAIGFLRKGNSLVPINWGMDLNIFQRNFTSQKQDRKCAGIGQMALSEYFQWRTRLRLSTPQSHP